MCFSHKSTENMFWAVFLFLFLLAVILYYVLQKVLYKGLGDIPGPFCWPFVGGVTAFGYNTDYFFQKGTMLHDLYGPIWKVYPPWFSPYIVVADADLIEFFVTSMKFLDKSREYTYFHPWLGTGLLTSTGEKWQKRRKMITPAFHFKMLEQFLDVFNANSKILIQILNREVGKPSTDIYHHINNFALDVICETAMETSVDAQTTDESQYIKAVKGFLNIVVNRNFWPHKAFDCLFRISKEYVQQKKLVKILHNFTNSVIRKRREELLNDEETDEKPGNVYHRKKKVAFLDLLLKAKIDGKPLENEDIREEVDTFMFEGHDTVTSAVSFALYEIARHPEVQDKIVEEVDRVLGGKLESAVTYNDLQQMEYIQMVIKEALRLYPPVAVFERTIHEDAQFGKYRFPDGMSVVVHVFKVQRSPKHFPNPDEFVPERFTQENMKGKHPFCYIPFSAGPRNCIGQKFAMLEMKMAIAKIVKNFKLSPVPGHKLDLYTNGILKSLTGIVVKLDVR